MHHNVSKQQFHPVNNNPDEHTMRPSEIIEAPTRTTAPPLGAKFKIKKTGQNRVICIINRDRTPHNEIETAFRYTVRAVQPNDMPSQSNFQPLSHPLFKARSKPQHLRVTDRYASSVRTKLQTVRLKTSSITMI